MIKLDFYLIRYVLLYGLWGHDLIIMRRKIEKVDRIIHRHAFKGIRFQIAPRIEGAAVDTPQKISNKFRHFFGDFFLQFSCKAELLRLL